VAILSTSTVGLFLIMMFVILGFLGLWIQLKKDQDRVLLMYLCASVCFAFGATLAVFIFAEHAPNTVDCRFRNINVFLIGGSKCLYYLFLHRRGSLVQYSGNANKNAFRVSFVLAVLYGLFYALIAFVPGIIVIQGDVYVESTNSAFCNFSFNTTTLSSLALVIEVILSFLNVYLFSKPLRQHLREVQNVSSMSGNQQALTGVLKRNLSTANISIGFTLCQLIISWVLQNVVVKSTGDYGWAFVGTSFSTLDMLVSDACILYCMMNAWVLPTAMNRLVETFRSQSGRNTSLGNGDSQKAGTAGTAASHTAEGV